MVKVVQDFDMTLNELMEMDTEFAYLLDLFEVKSYKSLINTREELLETYLFGGKTKLDIETRKSNVRKYFVLTTLPKHIIKFIQE